MIAPVKQILHGDIAKQGLPFYSGAITYKTTVFYTPGDNVTVSLPDFEATVVKVSANGCDPMPIAWKPYEADITHMLKEGNNDLSIQYVLTRRNTFGPLHALPSRTTAYGPGNFITTGEDWTDDYVLLPAGMTAVPEIIIKK